MDSRCYLFAYTVVVFFNPIGGDVTPSYHPYRKAERNGRAALRGRLKRQTKSKLSIQGELSCDCPGLVDRFAFLFYIFINSNSSFGFQI
jgi:hypothetical protein